VVGGETDRGEVSVGAVRLDHVDRRQLCWAMLDVERLNEADHAARAIWGLVGRLDLASLAATIGGGTTRKPPER
jgi:hypothetical protein